jgi:hypothetical protein
MLPQAATMRRSLLMLVVLLGALVFSVKGVRDERHVLKFRDFKQPYASARCLLHGCNPYSETDTRAEFLRAGGTDDDVEVFRPYSALYPPFAFALLAPLAALPYHAAAEVWLWTIAGLFSIAALMIGDLCLAFDRGVAIPVLLAIFTLTSTILLMAGQISGPVLALMVIGFWCLLRERATWLAVLALSVALVLKPHDSALLVGYLLFAGPPWRRALLNVVAVTTVVVVVGTWWCGYQPASAHWLRDLAANLKGNAGAHGANDPALGSLGAVYMANLQPLFAAWITSERLYNIAAQTLSLLLLAFWAVPAWRMRNTTQKHVLALAGMACIMLLPIYHRQYDTRVLLLVFPAVALLLASRGMRWGLPALLLLAVATLTTSHSFLAKLTLGHDSAIEHAGRLRTLLLYRPLPETELVLAIFLLAAFYARYRADARLMAASVTSPL